jgi:poly(3-hydroxybutyrate) depolymerase
MSLSNPRRSPPSNALLLGSALAMPGALLPVSADAFEPAAEHRTAVVHDTPIELFIHRPPGTRPRGLLLVLHGQRRNAVDYRDYARVFGERHGLMVVAPKFDRDRFPNRRYQRGGITRRGRVEPREHWTVNLVPALLEWVRRQEGKPELPVYLFGHSAGGQFLSRVAAFADSIDARRIVIANPSSYVVANLNEAAPYGMGGVFDAATGEDALRRYLGLPITVYLGGRDTGSYRLHSHPAAQRQGANRLERGRGVFERAAAMARDLNTPFNWQLVIAPGIDHSGSKMLKAEQVDVAFGLVQ